MNPQVSQDHNMESVRCDANRAVNSYGREQRKEFILKYAERQCRVYADMFLSRLNEGLLDGRVRENCKTIIRLCRAAGLDEEDTEATCAELVWPICAHHRFGDLYDECVVELEDELLRKAAGGRAGRAHAGPAPAAGDRGMAGKVDSAILDCKALGYSPIEAAAAAMDATGCHDHMYVLDRVELIYHQRQ